MPPSGQDMCPALKSQDPGGAQTSEQAIIPQVSGAGRGWRQAPRRHTAGEEADPICQGLEGLQKLEELTTESKGCRGEDNMCVPQLWVWGYMHLGVCLGMAREARRKHVHSMTREHMAFKISTEGLRLAGGMLGSQFPLLQDNSLTFRAS